MAAENPSIKDFAKARVIVVGDCIRDIWAWGHWSKIGPEGVPVFLVEREEEQPGGANNVGNNIGALGAAWLVLGKPQEQWPIKTRFSAHGTVFRADREDCSPISEGVQQAIMGSVKAFNKPDALVISDYAKGVCTPDLCQALIGWAKVNGVKVIVDPKGTKWKKYEGADIITPNESEYRAVANTDWCVAGASILMTAGSRGCDLLSGGPFSKWIHIEGRKALVKDVTGCGDTFVATLACALAAGFDLPQAARIANAAASVVVGKPATASCNLEELEAACTW